MNACADGDEVKEVVPDPVECGECGTRVIPFFEGAEISICDECTREARRRLL